MKNNLSFKLVIISLFLYCGNNSLEAASGKEIRTDISRRKTESRNQYRRQIILSDNARKGYNSLSF